MFPSQRHVRSQQEDRAVCSETSLERVLGRFGAVFALGHFRDDALSTRASAGEGLHGKNLRRRLLQVRERLRREGAKFRVLRPGDLAG